MIRKVSSASSAPSPRAVDDFKSIRGIGPILEKRLHKAGILTLAQLSRSSPKKLAAVVTGLSAERISRENWIGQARKLASKKARPKSHKKEPTTPTIRQHYENFTVEFLLDEKNEARRTRVVHIQSGDADKWAGWKAEQLIDFLARHTEVYISAAKLAPQEIAVSRKEASQNTTDKSSPMVIQTSKLVPPSSTEAETAMPVIEIAERILPSPAAVDLAGTLRLRDLRVVPIDSDIPIFFLQQGEPYRLRLPLDLTEVVATSDVPLEYEITIIAKQPGGPRQLICEERDILEPSESITIRVAGNSLPPGVYRLDAFVRLTSDETAPGLTAFLKGDLLQVY